MTVTNTVTSMHPGAMLTSNTKSGCFSLQLGPVQAVLFPGNITTHEMDVVRFNVFLLAFNW